MIPLSVTLFSTHPHNAASLYRRRRRRRYSYVIEYLYLRRDMCSLIRKIVISLIYNYFNLKFASGSIYISLLFYRLIYLFFKLIRYVFRIFRLIVVARIFSLIVFTLRYLDSYYVIINFDDFESKFSNLRILIIYFENYLTYFNYYKCEYYYLNLYEILIFL